MQTNSWQSAGIVSVCVRIKSVCIRSRRQSRFNLRSLSLIKYLLQFPPRHDLPICFKFLLWFTDSSSYFPVIIWIKQNTERGFALYFTETHMNILLKCKGYYRAEGLNATLVLWYITALGVRTVWSTSVFLHNRKKPSNQSTSDKPADPPPHCRKFPVCITLHLQ